MSSQAHKNREKYKIYFEFFLVKANMGNLFVPKATQTPVKETAQQAKFYIAPYKGSNFATRTNVLVFKPYLHDPDTGKALTYSGDETPDKIEPNISYKTFLQQKPTSWKEVPLEDIKKYGSLYLDRMELDRFGF